MKDKKVSDEDLTKTNGGVRGKFIPHPQIQYTDMKCANCGFTIPWSGIYSEAGPYNCSSCNNLALYSQDCFGPDGKLKDKFQNK